VTIEGLIAELEDKGRISGDAVEAFEALIGTRIPEDYRTFLIASNGGYLSKCYRFKGPSTATDVEPLAFGGLRREGANSLESSLSMYQIRRVRIPRELIWIAGDGCGNAVCLGVHGKYRGSIYFWNHEGEPLREWDGKVETARNLTWLANSFSEFVAGLKRSRGD
jgi:hypothetical protein